MKKNPLIIFCWWRCGGKGLCVHGCPLCRLVQTFWRLFGNIYQNLKGLSLWPWISVAQGPVWCMSQVIHLNTVIGKDWWQSKSMNRKCIHTISIYVRKGLQDNTAGWRKARKNHIYSMLLLHTGVCRGRRRLYSYFFGLCKETWRNILRVSKQR